MSASVSKLMSMGFSILLLIYLMKSLLPLRDSVLTEVLVANYAQELADAIQLSIDIEKEVSQCPNSMFEFTVSDLIRNGILDSMWADINDISFEVVNREVKVADDNFIKYPSFIYVTYSPKDTELLTYFSASESIDVNKDRVIYQFRVKRSHRYFSSYVDKSTGCAIE